MAGIELNDVLNAGLIDMTDREFADKDELFRYISELFYKNGIIEDIDEFMAALYEREATGSTYMGEHLAVPHGKAATVKTASASIVRCKEFDYVSDDDHGPVSLCVMLAIPDSTDANDYIRILANFTRLLMQDEFMAALKTESDPAEIIRIGQKVIKELPQL